MKKLTTILLGLFCSLIAQAQINTDRVMIIGRNALYFEDYILSIQYFNQVIQAKPYLAEPYFFRAAAKFYLDDSKGAEDDCTEALERNPFMTKAYQLRGDSRQAQDKYEEALEDYTKALDVYPNDKFVLINIGIANAKKKDFEASKYILDELIKKHPKYTQGYLVRGSMYQESGDTINAFEDYNSAIDLDKFMSQSFSMRGLLFYNTKEYDKALLDLDEAIRLEPFQPGNYINRGLIRYGQNNIRGAMDDYDKVIGMDSYNTIARFNRGLLRSQVGDNNRAIEDFDMVLSHEPNNYIAYLNRAITKNQINDYNGALKDLNIVLDKYPDFYQGYHTRAEIKRNMNNLKGADDDRNLARNAERKIREEVAQGKHDDKEESTTRAKSDDDLNKFDLLVVADKQEEDKSKFQSKSRGQVQNKQVTIELMPRYVITYYEKETELASGVHFNKIISDLNFKKILPRQLKLTNTAVALNELQIKEHFETINHISAQIANYPLQVEHYYARGIEYMLVQDFSASIIDFSKAIELDPNFTLAYFNLAVVYTKQLELKENEKAENDTSVKIGEDFFSKQKNKEPILVIADSKTNAISIGSQFEYEQVIRNYMKVTELDSSFIYAFYNKGEMRFIRNDYRGAILEYNEVIRLNPRFGEAYYNRGLCRFYLNDRKNALDDMRKAGELGMAEAYSIIKRMAE